MSVVDILRELRIKGKDLGKTETDAILRIYEKAKMEDVDSIVLETCFQGAISVFESYLLDKSNKLQKQLATRNRKSPGRFIMDDLEILFMESITDKKIRENFPKIEEIYRDFPFDRDIHKMYLQFLSQVDAERAKKEILIYLESGNVTIHLGSLCITLLGEMGFLYDAKKNLGWYVEEFVNEIDGKYTELMIYLLAYLKEGRMVDRQKAEGLSDIFGSRKDSYYIYIENCFHILTEREGAIRQQSEGLYLYKEKIFRDRLNKIIPFITRSKEPENIKPIVYKYFRLLDASDETDASDKRSFYRIWRQSGSIFFEINPDNQLHLALIERSDTFLNAFFAFKNAVGTKIKNISPGMLEIDGDGEFRVTKIGKIEIV